jgi:hypothetical protein
MDQEEYTTLMQVFQGIPDPRKARGKRYLMFPQFCG